MKKINEMINYALEVLVANGLEKTGRRTPFTGYQDLNIDEIEMMEFLFKFEGSMEKFVELAEENKGCNANTPIDKLMYHLNKTHNFGFLNHNKVEVLNAIEDISQIHMKERHITYLNILRNIKPDINILFVDYYNQIHSHLNPFMVEQVLFSLYETLDYEGLKMNYKDFSAASISHFFTGDWKPYFSPSNWGYYIVDSFGRYNPYLSLYPKNEDGTGAIWSYRSSKYPNGSYGSKKSAEAKISQLKSLNEIAGIEGLNWSIQFANINDMYFNLTEEERTSEKFNRDRLHIEQEVPKGKITMHKKLVKELLSLSKRSA